MWSSIFGRNPLIMFAGCVCHWSSVKVLCLTWSMIAYNKQRWHVKSKSFVFQYNLRQEVFVRPISFVTITISRRQCVEKPHACWETIICFRQFSQKLTLGQKMVPYLNVILIDILCRQIPSEFCWYLEHIPHWSRRSTMNNKYSCSTNGYLSDSSYFWSNMRQKVW